MKPAIVVALLLLAGGTGSAAAAPPQKQSREPQHDQCDIGVVSNLGERFTVKEQVLVLGDTAATDLPVESWHLDDLVVERVKGTFGRRAMRVSHRKDALAVMETIDNAAAREGPLFQLIRSSDRADKVADAIRTLTPGTRCAKYIVVTESTIVDDNGIALAGISINRMLGLHAMHAVIAMMAYSGDTFKVSGTRRGHCQRSGIQLFPTDHPKRLVDASFWPDPPASAEHNTNLRDMTRELLTECLDRMLPKLSLTP